MEEEIWAPIDIAPHYEISRWGNVRHRRIQRDIRLRNSASERQYVLLNERGRQLTLYTDELVERHFK